MSISVSKKLVVANWKMNPQNPKEALRLFSLVNKKTKNIKNVDLVFCPPFVWLPQFSKFFSSQRRKLNRFLGAQDQFWQNEGAFTGEISPLMLKNLNVSHVIIGHSERRYTIGESDEVVNLKVKSALENNLNIILAVGEKERSTKEELESQTTAEIITNQVKKAFEGIKINKLEKIIVAYEPVWAIGTGVSDTPSDAAQAALHIRKVISKLYGTEKGRALKVLYGGSVNTLNTKEYIREIGIDGVLVGGASLNADEFSEIVKKVSSIQ